MASNTTINTPQWSGLHQDLLSNIAKRLETHTELLYFRAVCYSWRSSIPLPPKTPPTLKLPFPLCPNPDLNPNRHGHFFLTQSIVYSIQPLTKISHPHKTTKTWLLKTQVSNSGQIQVKQPLSISLLPLKNLTKHLPKDFNLLDYKVTEIAKAHGLVFVESSQGLAFDLNEMKSIWIKKVVIGDDGNGIFAVIAIHIAGKLSVWRMGDKKWTNIEVNRERVHFDDIEYYKGMFYALDFTGFVVTVDCSSLKVTEVVPPMASIDGFQHGGQFKYLVKSNDDLYLIDKYYFGDKIVCNSDGDEYPIHLNVFKLDEENKEWVNVFDGLGDRVFFIGDDCSFSVSGRDFAGCKRNCIYFTDDDFLEANDDYPGCDSGIFDLEDDTAGPLSAFPGYSNIFWPPPTWIFKPKPRASRA